MLQSTFDYKKLINYFYITGIALCDLIVAFDQIAVATYHIEQKKQCPP